MKPDETVSMKAAQAAQKEAPQRDLAPVSATVKASATAEDLTALPIQTENFLQLEPAKRQKTWGEKCFDLFTYGGIGLIGNEIASYLVIRQAEDGIIKNQYKKFTNYFTKMEGAHVPDYVSKGRFPELLLACVGGMLIVPPIKGLEDRKGAVVRKLDSWRHGKKADTDPAMVEAHQEMDHAPKQSWGSLWKGRVITVVSATIADALFGWRESLLPKLTKNMPTLHRFSSLDHISDEVSKGYLKLFKVVPEKSEQTFKKVHRYTWLLTLSASLTLLFYISSKMFAQNSAAHKERRQAKQTGVDGAVNDLQSGQDDSLNAETQKDAPSAKVSQTSYQQPLEQLQQANQLS